MVSIPIEAEVYKGSYGRSNYTLKINGNIIDFHMEICGSFGDTIYDISYFPNRENNCNSHSENVKFIKDNHKKIFDDLIYKPDALRDSTKMLFEARNMKCVITDDSSICKSIVLIIVIYAIAYLLGMCTVYIIFEW